MDYLITILISIVSGVLVFILQSVIRENHRLKNEKETEEKKEREAIAKGVRGMLKKELKEVYDKYRDSDSIPRDAFETWTDMFDSYEGLRGNGAFKQMNTEMHSKHII